MVGVIFWALAVIAIFLLLKGYYDYKYFIACYKGLIFSGKWVWQFLVGRWEWLISLPNLKQAYVIIAGIIAFALLILFFRLYSEILFFDWGRTGTTEITETTGNADSSIRNLAIAFLGTTSGIGALFGVYLAIRRTEESKRQNDTAEQGLITDRINKAVESLGKLNRDNKRVLEVRIGALYALERIAQDSIRDHIRIMKIICAYIYVREPLTNSRDKITAVGEDVRAALIIIGQRHEWTEDQRHLKKETEQKYELDLRHCNLHNAELKSADMRGARLTESILEECTLTDANLTNTIIQSVNLTKAHLTRTDFKNAYTGGSFAYEGDFSECRNLTQKQLKNMYCGMGVNIINLKKPNNLTRPGHWPTVDLTRDDFMKAYEKWEENRPK